MDAMAHRRTTRAWNWLGLALCLFVSSGATCMPWTKKPLGEPSPVMFHHTPTLAEVIQKVNQNTAAIRQLQADAVRISTPGAPSLKATLALEMPRRLRVRGDLLMSRELDIGSNEQLFWIWGKNTTGALLYAGHEEFAASPTSELLPVDPQWLIDALGLVMFDPAAQHAGPYAHGPGALEVHSQILTPRGEPLLKVTAIHVVYGWVLEQQIRDAQGRVLAAAKASNHRYYSQVGATLPDLIEVKIAPGTRNMLDIRIDVGGYRVNELVAAPDEFVMPTLDDYPRVHLTDPRAYEQLRSLTGGPEPTASVPEPYRPQYRGYSRQ